MVGSDLIHAVGEGRLGCEASGPPRGATWVTQTQTRFSSAFLVCTQLFCTDTGFVSLDFGSRKGFDEGLRFAIRYCESWRCDILSPPFLLPLASTHTAIAFFFHVFPCSSFDSL